MNIFRKKRPRNEAIIDLGRNLRQAQTAQETPISAETAPSDDFLGALATAASASATENQPVRTNDLDIADSLEKLGRRINKLLERLDLMEHKVLRLEHRIDLKY